MKRFGLVLAVVVAALLGALRAYADCSGETTGHGWFNYDDVYEEDVCGFLNYGICYFQTCHPFENPPWCLNEGQPSRLL
jgi:hypothetical protein